MAKKKKNKVVPRTDANQGIRERNEHRQKERDYMIKKIAEARAKQMLAQQQRNAVSTGGESSTVSALGNTEE